MPSCANRWLKVRLTNKVNLLKYLCFNKAHDLLGAPTMIGSNAPTSRSALLPLLAFSFSFAVAACGGATTDTSEPQPQKESPAGQPTVNPSPGTSKPGVTENPGSTAPMFNVSLISATRTSALAGCGENN